MEENKPNIIHVSATYVDEDIFLEYGRYRDGAIAIQGFTTEGEASFTATVALPDETPNDGFVFLKGWSENEGIPEALEKAGIVQLTGRKISAGYAYAQEAKLLVDIE